MKKSFANRVFPHTLRAISSLLLTVFLAGCYNSLPDSVEQLGRDTSHAVSLSSAIDPYEAETDPDARGYKIGPSDVLEVKVYKAEDLSREVQVTTHGTINLPLIGDIKVAGKKPSDIEQEIAAKYNAGYLRSPQVTVFVKEYNSSRVTVDGAVKEPGVYPTKGHDTLTVAISNAHGLQHDFASSDVAVVHKTSSGETIINRYNLSDIHHGKSVDPIVHAGDIIIVEESSLKNSFYVMTRIAPLVTPFTWALLNL